MNFGEYSCIIDEPNLIQQMLSAKNKQDFLSNIFNIAELNWQINFYPNGNKDYNLGSFMVYLKLLSLPKSWKEIIVCRRILCPETASSATAIVSYTANKSNGWDQGTLKLNELIELQPKKLLFDINIRILKIVNIDSEVIFQDDQIGVNNDNNSKLSEIQEFKWKIDKDLLFTMQSSYASKCFESEIFQNQWCLRLYPNGKDDRNKGDFRIALQLCGLPPDIGKMYVNWKISCDEYEDIIKSDWTNEFDYKSSGKHWGKNVLNYQNLQQFNDDDININLQIRVLKVFDSFILEKSGSPSPNANINRSGFLYGFNGVNNNSSNGVNKSQYISLNEEIKEYSPDNNDMEQRMDILSKTVEEMKITIKELSMKLNNLEMEKEQQRENIKEEQEEEQERAILIPQTDSNSIKNSIDNGEINE